MFKCSGYDYAQVVCNEPEKRQIVVRERETDKIWEIDYVVGINLIPSSLIQLALQAEENPSHSVSGAGYKETDNQQGGDTVSTGFVKT